MLLFAIQGTALWRCDAWIFFLAAALVAVVWLGYPFALGLVARGRPRRISPPLASSPAVSLIIAAHNEAESIAARLANALALHYPPHQLEVLVAEDGSTDGTAEHVRACPDPRVHVLSAPARSGKAAALNRAVAAAGGEILVFSDANNRYDAGCLGHLVAPFADARVGAVAGAKTVAADAGVGGGESVYWRFERWLMQQESACGSIVNAPGEILAVRRSCFRALPGDAVLNDDLWLIWSVLAQGMQVRFAPAAQSFEFAAASPREEWKRRTRIASGRWRVLRLSWPLLARMRLDAKVKIAFHQILRPLTPLAMVLALLAGLPLLAPAARAAAPRWIVALAALQAGVYLAAGLSALLSVARIRLGAGQALSFFIAAQAGILRGTWNSFLGRPGRWARVQRAAPAGLPPLSATAGEPAAKDRMSREPRPPLFAGEAPVTSQSVIGGLAWAGSSFLLGKLFVFGSVVLLARLLRPQDFGVITLVLTCIMFLEIFGRLGLYSALIFEPGDITAAAAPVFWLTLSTAAAASGIAFAAAPWVAQFFHEPLVRPMLRVLAPTLIVTALGGTHDTLLRRALAFRRKLLPDLGLAGAKGVGSVLLALLHFGAWSLIWGQWLGIVANTLVLWSVVPWRPRRQWDRALARRLLHYAKHIYLMETSGTVLANLDSITIGHLISDYLLGFYTLAFRIPEVVLISILNIITGVIFPALSRLQDDRPALQDALLHTVRYSVLFGLPLAAGMALLSRNLIAAVYGPRWAASVPVLQVLAIYAGLRCVSHHFGDAYKAMGRPDILSRLTFLWWIILPPALVLGARWGGIVGVAWGQVVARALMTGVHFFLVVQVVKIAPARLWRAFAPALEATAGMTVIVFFARFWLRGLAAPLALCALSGLGGAVYAALLLLRHRHILRLAWETLHELAIARVQLKAASSAPK